MNNKTNAIIYQLALRTFTPEGTLRAAATLLPHIASLGVDILYVCPFFAEEEDTDRITWSERQKKSETNNHIRLPIISMWIRNLAPMKI